MKQKLTVSINPNLIELANEYEINISNLLENTLKYLFNFKHFCIKCDKIININYENEYEILKILAGNNANKILYIHKKCMSD